VKRFGVSLILCGVAELDLARRGVPKQDRPVAGQRKCTEKKLGKHLVRDQVTRDPKDDGGRFVAEPGRWPQSRLTTCVTSSQLRRFVDDWACELAIGHVGGLAKPFANKHGH